jgi:hypothetical protein
MHLRAHYLIGAVEPQSASGLGAPICSKALGEGSLRRAVTQFIEHYHLERPDQGKGNQLLFPAPVPRLSSNAGRVQVTNSRRPAEVLSTYRMNIWILCGSTHFGMRLLALVNGQLLPKCDCFQCQIVTRDHKGGDIRQDRRQERPHPVMLLADR